MSTSLLIVVSVLSAVEVLVILASVSEHWLKAFLGYKIWADLIYGLGIMIYMGLSGTISGVIISTFAAFFMTCTLTLAAGLVGYKRRTKLSDGTVVWVNYAPTITVESLKNFGTKWYQKISNTINSLISKPAQA